MLGKRQCTEALRNDPAKSNHAMQTLQEAHLGTPSKVAKCGAPKGTHKAARSNNCKSFEEASEHLPANGPALKQRTTRSLQGAHLGAPLQVVLAAAPTADSKNVHRTTAGLRANKCPRKQTQKALQNAKNNKRPT